MSSVTIISSEVVQFGEATHVVRVNVKQNERDGIEYSYTFLFYGDDCNLPVGANIPEHVVQFAITQFSSYKNWKQFPIITEERKLARQEEEALHQLSQRSSSQNYMGTGRPYDPLCD